MGKNFLKRVNSLRRFCRKYTAYRRAKIPHLRLPWVYKKLSGFSLIEIAFVLLIVGIAASLTFPLLTASQKLERHKATEAHQDQIFRALAGYVLKYNRLPDPSTPELVGEKGIACNKRREAACVGIIPYQELGLSESIARDGHGHWFTYAVAKDLTADYTGINEQVGITPLGKGSTSLGDSGFCRAKSSGITLTSLANVPVLTKKDDKNFQDGIALVLVSHGPKGTGAFHQNTSERLPAKHPLELKNSTNDGIFAMRTSQDIDPDFTHEIYWVTRNNLMAIYGKYPCQPITQSATHTNSDYFKQNKNQASPPSFSKDPTKGDSTGLY